MVTGVSRRNGIAYATTKGALASITRTLADHCADQAITLNTVTPGPVDTGGFRRSNRPPDSPQPQGIRTVPIPEFTGIGAVRRPTPVIHRKGLEKRVRQEWQIRRMPPVDGYLIAAHGRSSW
ncbi:SDR family oxidoreductase [Nocardia sp. NPDC005366]|uniref:SDR family oxidoreductase n=1 Tax=Nocardia sp. NPDC005366 TaxID=3156878 RepID=UPI0033BB7B27